MNGIHFAMDEMLSQQNRVLAGQTFPKEARINAKGKNVLVIGGGDTGSDCIGTSIRQGGLERDTDRDNAEASGGRESCDTVAAVASGPEDEQQP